MDDEEDEVVTWFAQFVSDQEFVFLTIVKKRRKSQDR